MNASFWMVGDRFGDRGIELFMRLDRQQKIQFSALMAKAEIQLMTATVTDQLFKPSERPVKASQKHWVAYQESLDRAKDILVSAMSISEQYLSLTNTRQTGTLGAF